MTLSITKYWTMYMLRATLPFKKTRTWSNEHDLLKTKPSKRYHHVTPPHCRFIALPIWTPSMDEQMKALSQTQLGSEWDLYM